MPPKSKKGQKMDLSAFLADENTGGSWADEMDTLPTGPSAMGGGEPGLGGSHLTRNMRNQEGGFGGGLGRGGFDDGRPQRAEVPIPTEPPFTAFVGNLTFEVIEADLEDFFTGLGVKSVRLVSGQDGKPRGFGYVEFNTVDDLKNALTLTGADLGGRVVRISVAEASTARMGRADEASTWERTGPLPSLGGRQSSFGAPRSGGFGMGGGGGFDDVERDGPIRGGKFTPSAPMADRRDRGPGFSSFERALPVEVERDAPIRGGKFTPSAPPQEAPRRSFGGGFAAGGEPSRADEGPWSRSGPLPPAAGQDGRRSFGTGFGAGRTPSDPPAARRPLQLSARSATPSDSPSGSPSGSPAPSSRSNPFGNAKPIDTATKEKEVEEKLAKQRKEAAEQAQKEREEKDKAAAAAAAAAGGPAQAKESKSDGEWVRRGPLPASSGRGAGGPKAAKDQQPLAPPVPAAKEAAPSATRKEGFSYSSAAGKDGQGVDDVTKGVEETKI
ncbi:hypothetical protein JCM10212_004519 [Sporobolomyces blumeae]